MQGFQEANAQLTTMYNVLVLFLLLFTRAQMEPHRRGHNMTLLRSVLTVIRGRENWKNTPIFLGGHCNSDDLNNLMSWLQNTMEVTCHTVDTSTSAKNENALGHFNINADNSLGLLFCQSSHELIWFNMDIANLPLLETLRLTGNPLAGSVGEF